MDCVADESKNCKYLFSEQCQIFICTWKTVHQGHVGVLCRASLVIPNLCLRYLPRLLLSAEAPMTAPNSVASFSFPGYLSDESMTLLELCLTMPMQLAWSMLPFSRKRQNQSCTSFDAEISCTHQPYVDVNVCKRYCLYFIVHDILVKNWLSCCKRKVAPPAAATLHVAKFTWGCWVCFCGMSYDVSCMALPSRWAHEKPEQSGGLVNVKLWQLDQLPVISRPWLAIDTTAMSELFFNMVQSLQRCSM